MAEVKTIFTGYLSEDTGGHTCCTVTLVRDGDHKIICDPGTLPDLGMMEKILKEEKLSPDDIDIIYLTHSHVDHFRSIGVFPKAKILDYWGWWHSDTCTPYKEPITPNVEMINTPGHSTDGTSLVVKTEQGTIVICGDVFWKDSFLVKDPLAIDQDKLDASRQKVLSIADFVIPGHGPMFEVKKD